MLTQNLGYPRIGGQRQLKKACEQFWAGKIDVTELNSITSHVNLLQTKLHWPFATKCLLWKKQILVSFRLMKPRSERVYLKKS